MNNVKLWIIAAVCLLFTATLSAEYTITFGNGDRITGNIKGVRDGNWVVETMMLGTVELPVGPVTVTAQDGRVVAPEMFSSLDEPEKKQEEKPDRTLLNIPWVGSVAIPEDWKGNFSVGITDISGSSEKRSLSWASNIKIPYRKNEFSWATFYKYSESSGKKDVDHYGTSLRYRRDLGKRTFIQSRTSYSVDQVKGIDAQLDQTLGLGYSVIKNDTMEWSVVPGIAYQYVDQPGTSDGGAIAYNLFEDFSWKLAENMDFEHTFNIFVPSDDSSQYNYLLTNGISTKISKRYVVKVSHEYDFDNSVAAGNAKYTSTFITSLGYTF